MAHYLMWEYKLRDTGVFHHAASNAQRAKMIGKGYADITGQQVWTLPYPEGKAAKQEVDVQPAPIVPEPPAETLPEVEEPVSEVTE
jgi:hypothetical protein